MLLWVSSFGAHGLPAALDARVPAVVLGHPALAAAARARGASTVFIPVATPGIDIGGHLFRTDGSIVVPLKPVRGAPLPSVGAIAARLVERLAPPRLAPDTTRRGLAEGVATPHAGAPHAGAQPAAAQPVAAQRTGADQ
jgi:formylmethanofuran dehydrogenase subunit B